MARNTATRDKHRATIARTEPPCAICGQPINYSLPHLDPMSYVVDHVIPLSKGGTDTLNNKQPAHRACNRTKSDRLDQPPETTRTYTTHRTW